MAVGSVSLSRVATVAESAFGVIPVSPGFTNLRRASGGLRTNKNSVALADMQFGRDVTDVVELSQSVSGSYDFEFSAGSFDATLLAPAMFGAWSGNILVNGATDQSQTFEETFQAGSVLSYRRFVGCKVDRISLVIPARGAIRGTAEIKGSREYLDADPLTGATYATPADSPVETGNSVTGVALFGVSRAPIIRQLVLQIDNKLTMLGDSSSLYDRPTLSEKATITGTIEAYFPDSGLYAQSLAHGSGSVSLTIGGTGGARYAIFIPKTRLLDGAMVMGGKNDDLIASLPFQALYSPTIGGSLQLTRHVT